MKGWVRPQPNVLPIIACKNLAFNQRRCVESVGNLVWALTRTANYSKQGKFVSPAWEDAVRVQSKQGIFSHQCLKVHEILHQVRQGWWLLTGLPRLPVYISHIKTGFQLKHRSFFTNNTQPDDWNDGMCTREISFVATKDDNLTFRKHLCREKGKFLNWLTVWILEIYCPVISFNI